MRRWEDIQQRLFQRLYLVAVGAEEVFRHMVPLPLPLPLPHSELARFGNGSGSLSVADFRHHRMHHHFSALLRGRARGLSPQARSSISTQTLTSNFFSVHKIWSYGGGERGSVWNTALAWSSSASKPSLSIWRRKKEMGKEGLFVVHELKRLARSPGPRMENFMRSHVSRLVRTDLFAVLAEFQRQDLVFLSMKIYDLVRQEIWYRPDMFFYRDMLLMLARNKKVEETRKVWEDLRKEEVLFDQHTYGDIVRAYLDGGLPSIAMEYYDEMRRSPDPPLFLPFRVMLKGLIPYPELREKVRKDFLELYPHLSVYDPPEDLFDEQTGRFDGGI